MRSARESFGFSDEGISDIVLDSRKKQEGALFVPIIGERSDAHDFIPMAIENGASAILSSRDIGEMEREYPSVQFYQVADTRQALQEVGYMERQLFRGAVIGVTGSVGKTTTRTMLSCALSSEKKVFQTKGNANSQVGVPITMFHMARSGAELAVVELGMSEFSEMSRISNLACLDMAVITNIGTAHIENLKTQENILIEKLHILDGMKSGGVLFLNEEDALLSKVTRETLDQYGIAVGKEIKIKYYHTENLSQKLSLVVKGQHMLQNAAAALAVCEELGISEDRAREALSHFHGVEGRGETFRTKRGITVIDDAYNASPDSMRASLTVLSETEGKRKIAVLGDMLELGEESARYHKEIGRYIAKLEIDKLLLYGELSNYIREGLDEVKASETEAMHFTDFSSLSSYVNQLLTEGDIVLFKASHSLGLSKIVDQYREERI